MTVSTVYNRAGSKCGYASLTAGTYYRSCLWVGGQCIGADWKRVVA